MARPIREVPWLEQRDNGWFYAHWYDADKRRTFRESLKTRDPGEAAKRFGEFLLGGPGRRTRRDAGLSVSLALDDYLRQHVKALDDKGRPRVVDGQRVEIAIRHLKAYFGDRPMRDVGPMECRGYLESRRKMGLRAYSKDKQRPVAAKDSTVRRELSTLAAAANHAIKWGSLPAGDAPRIELPKVEDEKVKWFTKEQLLTIIEEATGNFHLQAFIRIAYYTAARRASIENLTKGQIDLKAGTIALQPPDGRVTKKRRPVVPLHSEIRSDIEKLLIETPNEYLFGALPCRDFYDRFVEACRACGFDGAFPHMLRHSRASHLLQEGVDIWKVAKLLGDTVATVERVYGHCLPEHLATDSNVLSPTK